MVNDDCNVFRDPDAELSKGLERALSDLVAAEQDGFGQGAGLHGVFRQCIAALAADLADMEKALVICVPRGEDTFEALETVDADSPVLALVYPADVAEAFVLLAVEQVFRHLLLAFFEIDLDLVELVAALSGVHEHDGEAERAEKVYLLRRAGAEGDDAVHLLRLAEVEAGEGDVVSIGHHLD